MEPEMSAGIGIDIVEIARMEAAAADLDVAFAGLCGRVRAGASR
jgi:hypothetical protein